MQRPKCIFLDIDGTLVYHSGNVISQVMTTPTIISGTLETIQEWDKKGYTIILTTGRRESAREQTIKQLAELGIFYDQLIMGIGGGSRILINDRKLNSEDNTAFAINLDRNCGIADLRNL